VQATLLIRQLLRPTNRLLLSNTGQRNTYNKPILAVNPFGQQKKSGVVLDNADKAVGWNKKPVISAIWNLYRG
jgi:hypothetical protein